MIQRLLVAALLPFGSRALGAQVTVTPASVGTMTIVVPVAGSDVAAVTNTVGSYTVKTKPFDINTRIQGQLSAPLPAGMSLAVSLTAPTGGVSNGSVTLNAVTPVDLVTAIPNKTTSPSLAMTYTYLAPAASGNATLTSITVTYTLSP